MAGKTTGMMCIVPNCVSAYFRGCRTRFHLFPKEDKMRKKWLKSLKLSPTNYQDGAMICYLHFDPSDYVNRNHRSTLTPVALPTAKWNWRYVDNNNAEAVSIDIQKALEDISDVSSLHGSDLNDDDFIEDINSTDDEAVKKDEPKKIQKNVKSKSKVVKKETKKNIELKEEDTITNKEHNFVEVCRTCLATGVKMYSMKQYHMEQTYALLTGIDSVKVDETKIPQMVCFECLRRLENFTDFAAKCLTALSFLQELIEKNKLTMADITSIDRNQNFLTSKLVTTHLDANHIDLKIEEYEYETTDNIDIANDVYESMEIVYSDIESNEVDLNVSINQRQFDEESDKWQLNEPEEVKILKHSDNGDIDEYGCRRRTKEFDDLFIVETMTPEMQRAEVKNRKKCRNYINAKFKCNKCYRGFQIEKPFSNHMKKHTNECGEFVCDICQMHFRKRGLLVVHISNTHSKYISCRKCPFGTVFETSAFAHKNRHDGFRFQCKLCPKNYSKRSTYFEHLLVCHPEDVICHLCGASLALKRDLYTHLRTTHRSDDLHLLHGAKLSRFGLMEKKNMSSEYTAVCYASSLPEDAPHCPTCDIRFRDEEALRVHLSQSPSHGHPPKYKPAKAKPKHNRESKKTEEEKKPSSYDCNLCGVHFTLYQSYYSHRRAEHPGAYAQDSRGAPQYICEVCGKPYRSISLLNDHRQSHSGVRGYVCAECGKSFATRLSLRAHADAHARAPACAVCGKGFSSLGNLRKHTRIHTWKPYACEPCNKRFCSPSERRAHVQHRHMGVPWPKKKPKREGRRGGTLKTEELMTAEKNIKSAVEN